MKTWFKHYTSSHLGSSFAMMRANRDFESMACFWLLLELMGRHESTTDDGTMVIPKKLLQQTWNVQGQRLVKIISKFTLYFDKTMRIESFDETYKVFVSKWPELQETRGGKRLAKSEQNAGRSKKEEVRSKKIHTENQKQEQVSDAFGPKDLMDLWNQLSSPLPQVKAVTDGRSRTIKARLQDFPDQDYWRQVITKIKASDFCLGKAKGSTGWKASFDWMIRPDTHIKIMEGQYDNHDSKADRNKKILEDFGFTG